MSRKQGNGGRYDITVAGLGVAGSTLAYHASKHGFKVAGYDVAPTYRKACGDVVSVRGETWGIVRETGSMLTGVKKFSITAGGVEVAYIDVGSPIWVIVDKSKLVNTLRELAASLG
ncbi:MAG: NAD(P)/FAD-dependent oxidoreductase, partial [Acidilobaceae archaeon]